MDKTEFHFRRVSSAEVTKIIYLFPSNKAPGKDKLSMFIIKDALPVVLPYLTEIINRSLETSIFPTAWKESEVIPLLKEGSHEVANNNRPVSLLPAISKICERIALNQLTDFVTQEDNLSVHQSGNKKMHSTETLNVFISDTILDAMDKKKITALVLLDFSKAFDSIEHSRLINKLRLLGVSEKAADWFKSFLSHRIQSVRIGHILSRASRGGKWCTSGLYSRSVLI